MIRATARVLKNVIELEVSGEAWTAVPVATAESAIARKIASLFSTTYETFRAPEPNAVYSTVTYMPKKDEVLVQVGEQKWRTKSSIFGPMTFEYGGVPYEI